MLFLSTSAIFVKLAEAPSGIIAFYRLLFTLCVLIPALLCRKKERKQLWQLSARQWRLAVVSGALLAIHWVMWFESLRYTSVASSTVLVSLQPLFSILWGGLLLHETVTKQGMAGVFLAIAGSVIIGWGDFQVSGAAFWGDVLSFASAGVTACIFLWGRFSGKNWTCCHTRLCVIRQVRFALLYMRWLQVSPLPDIPCRHGDALQVLPCLLR